MKSPLKWFGGKAPLAKWIVSLMPPHLHYVEPYFGSGAVLFAKDPEGVSEVANDLDGRLMNFWCVLRSPEGFEEFRRIIEATPVSEELWIQSRGSHASQVTGAVDFFILCRQGMAGRRKQFTPLSRTRTRRGMNEQVAAWLSAVEGLPEVHARLKRVVILCKPAVDVIRQEDGPQTLFYLDPPYLHDVRVSRDAYGEHEMTREDHERLLALINRVQGRVMISGYRSELYDDWLVKWTRHEKDVPNHASGAKIKGREVECVWVN